MIFNPTNLSGVFLISTQPFHDHRGWFVRTFCKNEFAKIGFEKEWVQLNHSYNLKKGTIRGMHYQQPPFAEVKLVRCIAGEIFDVIVDLRSDSETFLEWYGVKLSQENKKMLFIPEGFAHGFQTLKDHTEIVYHHSAYYTPESEKGILFNDPTLNIAWPLNPNNISEKDLAQPLINEQFIGIPIKR